MEQHELAMVEAMRRYGGGFVTALAECYVRADMGNREKIRATWPEIIERYEHVAGVA